jgi:hypothetical protein
MNVCMGYDGGTAQMVMGNGMMNSNVAGWIRYWHYFESTLRRLSLS